MQTAHNDADKALLGRLDGAVASGVYGAAYRLVDTAWLPIRALLGAARPQLFLDGQAGVSGLGPLVRALARPALGYALLAAAVLVLAADILVPLLGADYAESVPVLRLLAVTLVLRCVHYLPAEMLTVTGRQSVRTAAQLLVLGLNIALNLALIPRFGVWGAAWSTVACEALLAVLLWGSVLAASRQGRPVGGRR